MVTTGGLFPDTVGQALLRMGAGPVMPAVLHSRKFVLVRVPMEILEDCGREFDELLKVAQLSVLSVEQCFDSGHVVFKLYGDHIGSVPPGEKFRLFDVTVSHDTNDEGQILNTNFHWDEVDDGRKFNRHTRSIQRMETALKRRNGRPRRFLDV